MDGWWNEGQHLAIADAAALRAPQRNVHACSARTKRSSLTERQIARLEELSEHSGDPRGTLGIGH